MKNKVKCTCGWSWNKSDSSKKDMYICHECGRDNSNNMKNGGWLDSYADGGTMQEHQENYNDSYTYAPEGMLGDGYSNVGRNYSPAWGGSFQEGGEIPNAQSGRATRADSLAVFNNTVALNKHYDNLRKKGFYKTPEKIDLSWLKSPYQTEPLEKNLDLEKLKKETLKYYRDAYVRDYSTKGDLEDFKRTYPNKTEEDYKKGLAKSLKETKSGNKNKYYYKDIFPSQIDPLAPSTLIDTRIIPQYQLNYIAKNNSKPPAGGTITGMYGYDLLAVKPFDLLTDAEKKTRVEKYGTDGVPKSYLNKSKPTTTVKPSTKKPIVNPTKKKPIVNPTKLNVEGLQPMSVGLQDVNNGFETNLDIPTPVQRQPKYYDVRDVNNQRFGGTDTQYRVDSLDELRELPKEQWDRKITPHYQMGGNVYPVNYVPQAQDGGLTFLQPTSDKLPEGYRIPYSDPSSERAMSIGGENGEPAYLIPSFKYGKELYTPIEEFKKTGEHLGGPFKTWQEADEWERTVRHPAVENRETIMFPQEQFQTGGSMPGATGSMYARIGAPSKGPRRNQTDVTDASAQNGLEMQYYQNGLDWKPKSISKNGSIVKDDNGYWNPENWGSPVEIGSNDITMEGVYEPLLGVSDTGDTKLMKPGKNYKFKGKKVTEYPMAQNGLRQEQKGLVNLDNLLNFTNYNTKQPGGWLDTL